MGMNAGESTLSIKLATSSQVNYYHLISILLDLIIQKMNPAMNGFDYFPEIDQLAELNCLCFVAVFSTNYWQDLTSLILQGYQYLPAKLQKL